jgi:uncharacterized membrane protein (UPF0127 family)
VTTPLAALDSPRGRVVLRYVIGVVLVFGLLGCVVKGADNPADPYVASPGASSSRTPLSGFGETSLTVKTAGDLLEWCLLLAATAEQHQRGLMQVTDPALGGYQGMVSRYADDATEQYWMRNTPMPLSIAWVDATGHIVATADMAPCGDDPNCPDYPSTGPPPPYRMAIEVPQGKLQELGLVEGSTITDNKTACA